jgi:hypothetical protein
MTPEKRTFIKKVAHGVGDLMEYMGCVKRIGREPQNEMEKFIKKQLFNRSQDDTYEFSVGKFRMAVDVLDSKNLTKLLVYFDSIGITLDRAFTLASPNPLLFTKDDRIFVKMINDEDITTFYHLISF